MSNSSLCSSLLTCSSLLKAGKEVNTAFSLGGVFEGAELDAFNAWKKNAGARAVEAAEAPTCVFCKSSMPCGPSSKASRDSWTSCPVIMVSEASSSFDGFSGKVVQDNTQDGGSILSVIEASRVDATKAAMKAGDTELCHESCLKSVWSGRRMSLAQQEAEGKGEVGSGARGAEKWTTKSLGRDRSGGQYFSLKDELCRRCGESWSLVVDVEAFVRSLDPKHALEGVLRRNLLLHLKGRREQMPTTPSVLDAEVASKTSLLKEAENKLRGNLSPLARQEIGFAVSHLKMALRSLEYYALYVREYQRIKSSEGEEAAARFWQGYQLDFVDYTDVQFEDPTGVGWLRPSFGQTIREIRAETVAHRVLSMDSWYRRDKKTLQAATNPKPADAAPVNPKHPNRSKPNPADAAPAPSFAPYAEILADGNGVQWQEITGGFAGETYRDQPVLR